MDPFMKLPLKQKTIVEATLNVLWLTQSVVSKKLELLDIVETLEQELDRLYTQTR